MPERISDTDRPRHNASRDTTCRAEEPVLAQPRDPHQCSRGNSKREVPAGDRIRDARRQSGHAERVRARDACSGAGWGLLGGDAGRSVRLGEPVRGRWNSDELSRGLKERWKAVAMAESRKWDGVLGSARIATLLQARAATHAAHQSGAERRVGPAHPVPAHSCRQGRRSARLSRLIARWGASRGASRRRSHILGRS